MTRSKYLNFVQRLEGTGLGRFRFSLRYTIYEAKMTLPTRDEINPFDDLDGRIACENFYGKDLKAAERMFGEHVSRYIEDLMWMGPVAFRYYSTAAIRYLQNESIIGRADIITGLLVALEFRLQFEPDELASIAPKLVTACSYVLMNYERLVTWPEISNDGAAAIRQEAAKIGPPFDKAMIDVISDGWPDYRPRYARLQEVFSDTART